VSKYLSDDHGVFYAGNDGHITAALTAGFSIDGEYPF
jgi:hypothetical protein